LQLEFTGKEELNSEIARVYRFLTSPQELAKSIPDAEDVKVTSANEIEAKVKVKIAVISSSLKVRMKIASNQQDNVIVTASSSGAGSNVEISTNFKLIPQQNGTLVEWKADASVNGLIAGLGSSTLKAFAERYIKQVIENIHKILDDKT
jgi:carbon monoxide dehydrogenase subunit G